MAVQALKEQTPHTRSSLQDVKCNLTPSHHVSLYKPEAWSAVLNTISFASFSLLDRVKCVQNSETTDKRGKEKNSFSFLFVEICKRK